MKKYIGLATGAFLLIVGCKMFELDAIDWSKVAAYFKSGSTGSAFSQAQTFLKEHKKAAIVAAATVGGVATLWWLKKWLEKRKQKKEQEQLSDIRVAMQYHPEWYVVFRKDNQVEFNILMKPDTEINSKPAFAFSDQNSSEVKKNLNEAQDLLKDVQIEVSAGSVNYNITKLVSGISILINLPTPEQYVALSYQHGASKVLVKMIKSERNKIKILSEEPTTFDWEHINTCLEKIISVIDNKKGME